MLDQVAPDLEDLAAYLDGRLSDERKARVEEHLLRDEDYYDVFLETMRFQQQEAQQGGEQDGAGESRVLWWRSGRKIVPLLAAAAAIAIVMGVFLHDQPTAGDWIAELDARAIVQREGWNYPGWTRFRGDNLLRDRYSAQQRAFRMGAHCVHLQVALAAEDRGAAASLLGQIASFADASELIVAASQYQSLQERIDDADFVTLVTEATEIERALDSDLAAASPEEARNFHIGKWSEAGRLAALSQDADALRKVLRDARGSKEADEIAEQIETIEKLLEKSKPSAEDLDSAFGAFETIAKKQGG